MALPVSIGDAILLSQIAYNLGNAFSSGRKSAPAEFAEIRDLLFTLSGALKLLARGLPDADSTEGRSISRSDTEQTDEEHALLAQIIVNCRSTLSHLQALVEKYTALDTKPSQKDEDRRWTDEIRENLKKILWTREGGGVAKLKLTLIAHINGLNLAVGAINKSVTSSLYRTAELTLAKAPRGYRSRPSRSHAFEARQYIYLVPAELGRSLHSEDYTTTQTTIGWWQSANLLGLHSSLSPPTTSTTPLPACFFPTWLARIHDFVTIRSKHPPMPLQPSLRSSRSRR